jgi:hypothetical protein
MALSKRNVWAYASAFALGMALFSPLLCGAAHAQGVAAAEDMAPTGFRAGPIELHPELSARAGYDSNVYKADDEGPGPQSRVESAGIITLTPGLSVLTTKRVSGARSASALGGDAPPPKVELKINGYATFFQYLGLHDQVTQEEITLRGAEFDVSGDFHILPKRPVSLLLGGSWTRSARPFTASTGTRAVGKDDEEADVKARKEQRKAQAFNSIIPRARLIFESRGGVLTAFTGYRPNVQPFEGEQFEYLSNAAHDVDAGIGWRFFPSTALLYDLTLTIVDYYKLDSTPVGRQQVLLSSSKRVRSRMGINGAFTNRLSLRVMGGYSAGWFDNPYLDEFEQPVGEAILTYKFGGANQSVGEGGYTRNVTPAAVGGFSTSDRGFAKLKFVLLGLFAMKTEVGAARIHYGKQVAPVFDAMDNFVGSRSLEADGMTTNRDDIRIDASIRAEYRFISWLGVLADFLYQRNITDFDYGTTASPDPADYQLFQVNAGLRAAY